MTTTTVQDDATRVLVRLRGAFGALLSALPGRTTRPREIERLLSIDKTLAWRVAKLVHEPDIVLAAQHLPMTGAIETFLAAAERRGAPPDMVRDARDAFGDFERVVNDHAGSRAMLDMMLAVASPDANRRASRTHRKSAFQANSFIWGVQARVQFSAFFLHPSVAEDVVDIASVRGLIELRRVRPDVAWLIGRIRCINDDGALRMPHELSPVDPQPPREDGLPAVPLLRDFCSSPLPRVRRIMNPEGFLEDELLEAPAGNRGATTCVTGEIARRVAPRYRDEQNEHVDINVAVRTPSELLHVDVFVHHQLTPPSLPRLLVYSDVRPTTMSRPRPRRELLDLTAGVQHLNPEPAAVFTTHIPRYVDLVERVCVRAGWRRSDFSLYRATVEYPVLPSSVDICWELTDKPDSSERQSTGA